MTSTDLVAAWGRRPRGDARGLSYRSAIPRMRRARPTLLPVTLSLLVAGACSFGPQRALPDSFTQYAATNGLTFTAGRPPPEMPSAPRVLEAIHGHFGNKFIGQPAVATFGIAQCTRIVAACPYSLGTPAWLIVYPDFGGPGGSGAWVLVDAMGGFESGFTLYDGP